MSVIYDPLTGQPIEEGKAPEKRVKETALPKSDIFDLYADNIDLSLAHARRCPYPQLEAMMGKALDALPAPESLPKNGEIPLRAWNGLLLRMKIAEDCQAEGAIALLYFFTNFNASYVNDPERIAALLPELFSATCEVASFQRQIKDIKRRVIATYMQPPEARKKAKKEAAALEKKKENLLSSKPYQKALQRQNEVYLCLENALGKSFALPNFLKEERPENTLTMKQQPGPHPQETPKTEPSYLDDDFAELRQNVAKEIDEMDRQEIGDFFGVDL